MYFLLGIKLAGAIISIAIWPSLAINPRRVHSAAGLVDGDTGGIAMEKQREQQEHNYYLIPDKEIKPVALEIKPGHKYLIVLKLNGGSLTPYQEGLLKAIFELGLRKIMKEAEYSLVVVDREVNVGAYEIKNDALRHAESSGSPFKKSDGDGRSQDEE